MFYHQYNLGAGFVSVYSIPIPTNPLVSAHVILILTASLTTSGEVAVQLGLNIIYF